LYAIADAGFGDPVEIGRRLFAGGARLVQIRNKAAPARVLLDQTCALLEACPPDGIVIVNDRADVAKLARAHGVHLGQSDLPASDAGALLGEGILLGRSTHTPAQARAALGARVDYIAAGPVFPTTSRAHPAAVIGLGGLGRISAIARRPVVAIGGIRLERVPDVLAAGAWGVAVIADLIGGDDIENRTRRYIEVIDQAASSNP
jgi:thiamine-phosphate pyrophosphorylase